MRRRSPFEPQRPNGREARDDNGGSTERRKRRRKEETKKGRRKHEERRGTGDKGVFVRATLTHVIFRLLGSLTAIVPEILTYIDIDINIKNPNPHSCTACHFGSVLCLDLVACHRHLDQLQLLPQRGRRRETPGEEEEQEGTARVSPILPQPTWSATVSHNADEAMECPLFLVGGHVWGCRWKEEEVDSHNTTTTTKYRPNLLEPVHLREVRGKLPKGQKRETLVWEGRSVCFYVASPLGSSG
ncbi:hypothetical protein TRV_03264 [Trichophyton verrucosum HKI 0517]|uniref:Uncharacterized protein n=1 Tax=Trichophyton verrucosum (strain HKI 0517) TaxID=663202 RepID=D4D829_TRIVH|nr:uncharacterized protein TRV_03264 [Trichophyton verrucosum HKI 0517]EFE41989.1 hypothetical protein TRV_03264 [Trichophyton verrucosum HKI 0517]